MSTLVSSPFTTRARISSKYGETALLNWTEQDESGVIDEDAIIDAINVATQFVRMYTDAYAHTVLTSHELIIGWTTVLAAYELSTSRGNPPPAEIERERERIIGYLERVQAGEMQIPNAPWSSDFRPASANRRVDRRWTGKTVRVINDTDQPRSVLPVDESTVYGDETNPY